MPPCLMAKKASSDTDLMFQFYLPYHHYCQVLCYDTV